MRIRVLTFATATDAVGANELELEIAPGTDVGALKTLLEERYPALSGLWQRLAVAVDGAVVDDRHPIPEGSEVALLPPVSGGSGDEDDSRARLTEDPLDLESVAAQVTDRRCGAVVLFLGAVRDHHQGRDVEAITYSAYLPMAQARLRRIVDELSDEGERLRLAIHHRLGELGVGEASVVIAVSSPHREAAYEASREALERLKREVPIWKRERYADGDEVWREEERLLPANA